MSRRNGSLLVAAGACAAVVVLLARLPGLRGETVAAIRLLGRADITPVRDYLLSFGAWAPVVSAALQLLTSVLAPLPSFIMAFVNAMLYGWWWGAVLTWTTAMLAAAVCFGLARGLGRPGVEWLVPGRALERMDGFFDRRGVHAVLVARLIPFINPDVVSYAAGLTRMRMGAFAVAIGLGSLPSTVVYSYLGARGVTAVGWLLLPLVGLGVIVLIGAWLQGAPRSDTPETPLTASAADRTD